MTDDPRVFSPEGKADGRVGLGKSEVIDTLRIVYEIAESLKAEDHGVDQGHIFHTELHRGEDFSIAKHVLLKSTVPLTSGISVALATDTRGVFLSGDAVGVDEVASTQAINTRHLARHISVKTDTRAPFKLFHGDH